MKNLIYADQFTQVDMTDWSKINEIIAAADKNLELLQKIDKAALEQGHDLLYGYLAIPVADGKAHYQVTKVTKRSVTVTYCEGICPDGYRCHILGNGGTFPKHTILPHVQGRRAMEQLFSK